MFAVSDGEKGEQGETGEKGTSWLVGEGAPYVNAKLGDFYYDKLNTDIYLYSDIGWPLEVDLNVNETIVYELKDCVYTGILLGNDFKVTIQNQSIASLEVNGVPSEWNFRANYTLNKEKVTLSLLLPEYVDGSIVNTVEVSETFIIKENYSISWRI